VAKQYLKVTIKIVGYCLSHEGTEGSRGIGVPSLSFGARLR